MMHANRRARMHRFMLWVAAAFAVGALSACGNGGAVLSTTSNQTPSNVSVSVAAPVNVARVVPGGSLALAAVATAGSTNGILSNNRFLWSATLVSGGTYAYDAAGDTRACATITRTTGGVTTPYTTDFSIYITIDPTNEANVLFSPPPTIPAPAGSTLTTTYPYCVTVTANVVIGNTTPATTGAGGSITVAVTDPQNPLQ